MAIVLYNCDVCKRQIELPQNQRGLETPQRCIITQGCRGKLYQERVLQDYIRATLPDDVSGLDNYQQRKVLYNHNQTIENEEWVIEHNLGTAPSVSIYVDRPTADDPNAQIEILPVDTVIVSPDIIRLVFERPESGIAQLVARASDPDILRPRTRTVDATLETLQLTVGGEITIATRTSAPAAEPPEITIQLTYVTADGIQIPIDYAADDAPAVTSPWNDVDRVIVNGKVFTVRSFNTTTAQQITGIIASGSNVRLTGVNHGTGFRDINENEVLILLANAPYDNVDRRTTTYIDMASVQGDANPFAFFLDTPELFADETIIEDTHPPIRSV